MSNMTRSKKSAPTLFVTFAAALVFVMSVSARAAAEDQAAIDKLVQMNKRALEDYDTLEWDSAKRTLLDALMAGKRAGLDNHPVMARTYVHLGAVYITGFKNREKAIQSFVRALEIDASIALSKGISTSDVQNAFAEAQRKVGGGGGGGGGDSAAPAAKRRRGPVMEEDSGDAAPAPRAKKARKSEDDEDAEPDLPIKINALDCPAPDEAILDKPATLRCALSPKIPASKVFLMYRAPGTEEYNEVEMTKTPKGWFQGKIPKKAVVGKSIQFYFEGRNEGGKPVVRNGGDKEPNIMLIVEAEQAGKSSVATPEEEDENPLDEDEGPKKKRIILGRRDTATEGLDTRFGKRRFWIGLGFGSGFGYAKGDGLEAVNMSTDPEFNALKDVFQPGGAWAGMANVVPEFGYHLSPDFAVSIAGRLQYIHQPAQFARYTARGAISVLGKFFAFTKQSQVRFFGTAMAGGGEGFRFLVVPDPVATPDFKDTVRGGPIVGGLGGGVYYEASKQLSIVVEVGALAGFPLIGAVVDGTLAFQFNLY
jgi:hypothetical protein